MGGYHIGGMNICGLGVGYPNDLIGHPTLLDSSELDVQSSFCQLTFSQC
jgi:hypothetical protein